MTDETVPLSPSLLQTAFTERLVSRPKLAGLNQLSLLIVKVGAGLNSDLRQTDGQREMTTAVLSCCECEEPFTTHVRPLKNVCFIEVHVCVCLFA